MPAARQIVRKYYATIAHDFIGDIVRRGKPSRIIRLHYGDCEAGICPNIAEGRVIFSARESYDLCHTHGVEYAERANTKWIR